MTRVRALLAEARGQLDLARALGYATRRELDALYGALEQIEDKTESQGSALGLFDRLAGLFDRAEASSNASEEKSPTRPPALPDQAPI